MQRRKLLKVPVIGVFTLDLVELEGTQQCLAL